MDKDIKKQITQFDIAVAESMGLTPVEAYLAIKLGVSPQAIMATKRAAAGK